MNYYFSAVIMNFSLILRKRTSGWSDLLEKNVRFFSQLVFLKDNDSLITKQFGKSPIEL